LTFKLRYTFKDVYAGSDCSFLLTTEGKVLAFGNNEYNKLCLNEGAIGFRNDDRKSLQVITFLTYYPFINSPSFYSS
jgi:alpha-tubulin suppressor-like RCC1 family protein